MQNQLKDLYGRRTTPGVKILMLILVIFSGWHVVFSKPGQGDKTHAPVKTSIDIPPYHKDS